MRVTRAARRSSALSPGFRFGERHQRKVDFHRRSIRGGEVEHQATCRRGRCRPEQPPHYPFRPHAAKLSRGAPIAGAEVIGDRDSDPAELLPRLRRWRRPTFGSFLPLSVQRHIVAKRCLPRRSVFSIQRHLDVVREAHLHKLCAHSGDLTYEHRALKRQPDPRDLADGHKVDVVRVVVVDMEGPIIKALDRTSEWLGLRAGAPEQQRSDHVLTVRHGLYVNHCLIRDTGSAAHSVEPTCHASRRRMPMPKPKMQRVPPGT